MDSVDAQGSRPAAAALGLARGTVRVSEWDPQWPILFEAEAARLAAVVRAAALPPLEFEHVGSTSISGVAAKPIIDFMAGVTHESDPKPYMRILVGAGYEPRGEQGVPERELLVLGPEEKRTHHLNLVAAGGAFWRDHIAFRDRLRGDAALAMEYASLKRALAAKHAGDRAAYTAGKAAFVARVLGG